MYKLGDFVYYPLLFSRDERQTEKTQNKMHETIPGLQPASPPQTSHPVTSQELQTAFQHSGMAPGVMVTGPPSGINTPVPYLYTRSTCQQL